MKTLSCRSNIRVLGGIRYNSSKTVLNTLDPVKIKSRETPEQGVTVVKTTSNQGVCSQKSSFMREIPAESPKIHHMNKTSLISIPDMQEKENPNQIRHQGS